MVATTRIFVYEYLSGGGEQGGSLGSVSAGDLLDAGLAMRDAIAADLLALNDCDVSVAAGEHAANVPAGARAVVPRAGESAVDFVAREADAHRHVWVVAPETDGALAQLQHGVDPGRWLGCDAASIRLASAKRATALHLAEAGIATALAFEHAPEVARWVVKPDDGAGALATRLHASQEAALADWSQRSLAGSPMAIEPWIEGQAFSLSLLCGAGPARLLSVNRQRLAVDADGWLSFQGVDINVMPLAAPRARSLAELARAIDRAVPGLRGFVGIDLVWHARCGPVVIEINPRVTSAYVGLSRALGRNLAADVLAACSHD